MLVHIHKISSHDILDSYLAIGINKKLNQESSQNFVYESTKIDSVGPLLV